MKLDYIILILFFAIICILVIIKSKYIINYVEESFQNKM